MKIEKQIIDDEDDEDDDEQKLNQLKQELRERKERDAILRELQMKRKAKERKVLKKKSKFLAYQNSC